MTTIGHGVSGTAVCGVSMYGMFVGRDTGLEG
jgi:hypothetical protein